MNLSIYLKSFYQTLTFRGKAIEQLDVEVNNLIEEFNERFPMDNINDLTYETYALGHGDNTYSYWLEFKTSEDIGSIKGGSASKHGIYKGNDGAPKIVSKFNKESLDASVRYLLYCYAQLIEAGKRYDKKLINDSLISPSVRYKTLYMYFPNKFLPIFSEDHYDYLLNKLGIMNKSIKGIIYKQSLLIEYKNCIEELKDLSNYEFIQFLYYLYGVPKRLRDNSPEYKIEGGILNDIEIYNPNVNIEVFEINTSNRSKKKLNIKKSIKADYLENQKKNTDIGNKGEQIVLDYEVKRLAKYKDLKKKIKRVSLENDALGYDIESFEASGEKRFIEVKTTVSRAAGIGSFYISRNEIEKSKLENFWIYYVTEINSDTPKLYKIKGPIDEKSFLIEPLSFKVSFNIEKNN
nr:DUF3883 domain-containing protein [Macrococcus goetzii]